MDQNDAYRRARQRAAAKLGFYIHLLVYIVVNGILISVNFNTGRGFLWFHWPMIGWGIGLFFHGLAVFIRPKLMQQMIENELKKERDKNRK